MKTPRLVGRLGVLAAAGAVAAAIGVVISAPAGAQDACLSVNEVQIFGSSSNCDTNSTPGSTAVAASAQVSQAFADATDGSQAVAAAFLDSQAIANSGDGSGNSARSVAVNDSETNAAAGVGSGNEADARASDGSGARATAGSGDSNEAFAGAAARTAPPAPSRPATRSRARPP
jgi:hypothetical protein